MFAMVEETYSGIGRMFFFWNLEYEIWNDVWSGGSSLDLEYTQNQSPNAKFKTLNSRFQIQNSRPKFKSQSFAVSRREHDPADPVSTRWCADASPIAASREHLSARR